MSLGALACEGHHCDQCETCQGGVCCREDRPAQPLADPTVWEAPVYGDRGVLLELNDKVQCHICGEWFIFLGNHVRDSHSMPVRDYRVLFGLPLRMGLCTKALSEKRRQAALKNSNEGLSLGLTTWLGMTHEQRSERIGQLSGVRIVQNLMQDPKWKAAWDEKAKAGRRRIGQYRDVSPCVICGGLISAPASENRKVCGDRKCWASFAKQRAERRPRDSHGRLISNG